MKKKLIFLLSILFIFFINISFASEKLNLSINKDVIDTTVDKYNEEILFPWYIHNRFDLFKVDFSPTLLVKKHESKIIINSWSIINIDKTPQILNYLIEKLWEIKIKKILDSGFLHIIWDTNKTWSNYYQYSWDYYLSKNKESLKWEYLDITHRYKIYCDNNLSTKIILEPFDKNIFLGYRKEAEWPYPFFSIFDNSLLPQDLKIIVNNIVYYPKVKYEIQPYKIYKPYPLDYEKWSETMLSYVLIPKYEFDIIPQKWESILEINYKKYLWDKNQIIIQQSY